MRCFLAVLFVVVIMSTGAFPVQAQRAVGHSDATVVIPDPASNCAIGELHRNDDGSVENGFSWHYYGTRPPYYGAFGEAYDLGPGTVSCGAFWLTQVGYYDGRPLDVYIWDGGVTREPGEVLSMVSGFIPTNVAMWPDCGQNDITLDCDVTGEFTLGYWGDFFDVQHMIFICADQDGPGGHPWTCIAPGIAYPSGWQHPSIVWGDCASLVIGPFFNRHPAGVEEFPEEGPPAESPTWGQIKAIFGK